MTESRHPTQEEIIDYNNRQNNRCGRSESDPVTLWNNRKENNNYSASIDGPGKLIEKEMVDHPTHYGGEDNPYERIIIVKGGCEVPDKYLQWKDDNNVKIESYETEKEVLLRFTEHITNYSPHIITGYNITGFDFSFMYERSKELNCIQKFLKLKMVHI